jgi:hypothetical protein
MPGNDDNLAGLAPGCLDRFAALRLLIRSRGI